MSETYEYEVHCSETTNEDGRIHCEVWFYVVDAESEQQAEK
jgi:hypothetical protein